VKIDTEKWLALVSGKSRGVLPTLQRTLLAFASLPYSLAMRFRNRLYDIGFFKQHCAEVPVIVVGNLIVRRDDFAGDDQDVNGGLGIDIVEGQAAVIFVRDLRRDFPVDDFQEQVLSHHRTPSIRLLLR
jgi:hypothetical protein